MTTKGLWTLTVTALIVTALAAIASAPAVAAPFRIVSKSLAASRSSPWLNTTTRVIALFAWSMGDVA